MSYNLAKEKQVAVIAGLAEGNSIRSIERMTGIHRDTIMRLGVKVGQACAHVMDDKMHGLNSTRIEIDEIWGFIGKKKRNLKITDSPELGDAWTFVALDPVSKIVASYYVGKRDIPSSDAFLDDLASRLKNRIQLSSDTMRAYVNSVERTFGADGVDFAQLVKTYSNPEISQAASSRYSPGCVVNVEKISVFGNPAHDNICTSFVERQNLTLRMHCRRLTRLTNAFSKKLDNFKAAVALNFAYYNFVLRHATLRMTPAMAAGITNDFWTVSDLLECA